jgi:chlorophyllide a reductase subunit Y
MRSSRTSPSARRRWCSTPSSSRIPALYFTNLISARPLMGPAGAGSLAQVVNAALASRERFDRMNAFFEGVGDGDTAGVWDRMPEARTGKQRARWRPREAGGGRS